MTHRKPISLFRAVTTRLSRRRSVSHAGLSLWKGAAVTVVLACVSGCGGLFDNESADGGNTSTTENTFSARVLYSDGSPAPDVKAELIDNARWIAYMESGENIILGSVRTGRSGRFSFDTAGLGAFSLLVSGSDEGQFVHADSLHALGGTVTLGPYTSYTGTAAAQSGAPKAVFLSGLPLSADVETSGAYIFEKVPPGFFQTWVELSPAAGPGADPLFVLAGSMESAEGMAEVTDSLILTGTSLLLEDFEDADSSGLLAEWIPGGAEWWMATDWQLGGNSVILPGQRTDIPGRISDSAAFSGKSLHVQYLIGDQGTKNFSVIGLDIGRGNVRISEGKNYADFSYMTALTFQARGRGNIKVIFKTHYVIEIAGEENHFGAFITLSDTWQSYSILPSDIEPGLNFTPPDSSGLTWEGVKYGVSAILWQANDSAEVWLDDITLTGVKGLVFMEDVR